MVKLTIQDSQDVMEFDATLLTPILMTPLIGETDVTTIDGNISTYYGYTKRQYEFKLDYLDQDTFVALQSFIKRQYSNLKYPQITVEGAESISVQAMTAKMALTSQGIINTCGLVEGAVVSFRESRQMV